MGDSDVESLIEQFSQLNLDPDLKELSEKAQD